MKQTIILFVVLAFLSSCADSTKSEGENSNLQAESSEKAEKDQSHIPEFPLKEAFFGETHVHTSYSMDAFIAGNRLDADDAYRFAQGEYVESNGRKMKIKEPLDFCAVTDHAEYIGEVFTMTNPGAPGYDNEIATAMREADTYEKAIALFVEYVVKNNRSGSAKHPEFYQGIETTKSAWQLNQEATEKHYKPGKFTTLHAYEWTSAPKAGNLHRNIIFRDDVLPEVPYSAIESSNPVDLWAWMDSMREQGKTLLAIPHNSNGSKGLMFPEQQLNGNPIDKKYINSRARNEPLIEMMQIKGTSEVFPSLWPNDEFADFETTKSIQNYSGRTFKKQNFVRWGLTKGLEYEKNEGENPYKYGFVGGTDNHNGLPANVAEDNYLVGSHGLSDNTPERRKEQSIDGWAKAYDITTGAITGVWAKRNTREDIWDGMKSKETFATSGSRIKVRFFAGYDLPNEFGDYESTIENCYEKGVPMGSDLAYSEERTPKFIVWASKSAMGPNLDRIQIIKGWIENGELRDTVFNVIASDGREIKADGSIESVNAPINYETGEFNTEKGDPILKGVWTDPTFEAGQYAYYYVRVLELPTARWTYWDELRTGIKYPEEVPKTIIERAWGSPIWYKPN